MTTPPTTEPTTLDAAVRRWLDPRTSTSADVAAFLRWALGQADRAAPDDPWALPSLYAHVTLAVAQLDTIGQRTR